MKKFLIGGGLGIFALFALCVMPALAAENWSLSGAYTIDFQLGGGHYIHTMNVSSFDTSTGNFSGTGFYNPNNSYTWNVTGDINGNDMTFHILYTGTNAGYTVDATGTIANDGTMSGTAVSNSSQNFTWTISPKATFDRRAEITSPDENEYIAGETTFSAYLIDNDPDSVQWAVRKGTCAAATNTIIGNVDGNNTIFDWSVDPSDSYKQNFSATADTSSWDGGMYCFVFNPTENAGDTPIRLTREFYVADGYVHGGGQIIEPQDGKSKNDYKISFGGWIWDLGSNGYKGDWEVNLHNVSDDTLDKTNFHGSDVKAINFFNSDDVSCNDAVNFTVNGTWDGKIEHSMIFRAGDLGSPNTADTVRITIYDKPNGTGEVVYDTHDGDFDDQSECVGTARTGLDNGNITIWQD